MAYTGLRVFFIRAPYGVANSPFFVEPWIVRSPICFVPRTVEILVSTVFWGGEEPALRIFFSFLSSDKHGRRSGSQSLNTFAAVGFLRRRRRDTRQYRGRRWEQTNTPHNTYTLKKRDKSPGGSLGRFVCLTIRNNYFVIPSHVQYQYLHKHNHAHTHRHTHTRTILTETTTDQGAMLGIGLEEIITIP